MTINSIRKKLKRFIVNAKRFQPDRMMPPYLDLLWCFFRFGCAPDDYYQYEFYRKSNYERNTFVTWRRCQHIIKHNDFQGRQVLNDKAAFNAFFSDYINRDWLDLRRSTESEFVQFIKDHHTVLMKPIYGGRGEGVFKLSYENIKSEDSFPFDNYKQYIAEEIINQHPELAALNSSSVNTVRVYTVNCEIISTALKIGASGSIVDNLHSGGICAHVNEVYGIIDCACRNQNMESFLYHPISGAKLIGYQVPYWDLIIHTVKKASALLPSVPYIGWDVAIRSDGVELIEGNSDADHDLMQMIDLKGRYNQIIALL